MSDDQSTPRDRRMTSEQPEPIEDFPASKVHHEGVREAGSMPDEQTSGSEGSRGEHSSRPVEGQPSQSGEAKTWTKDPHGEHPSQPAEGRRDLA